ncbi:MAG: hypothetical protein HN337_09340 [Deltaproteobacteria bacterium]|jgi:uncharacterized secreted protein with C-terminal beta-propeller domain|nr:hypothetical protein [Deltaproteobacteria bacterium]
MKKKTGGNVLGCIVALVAMFFSGCGGGAFDEPPTVPNRTKPPKIQSIDLVRYDDCEEMNVEVRETIIQEMEGILSTYMDRCVYEGGGGDGVAYAQPDDESSEDAASFTDTNVQEAGVDEADLIKTDGIHAYGIVKEKVQVVRAWPPESFGMVANIEASEGKPDSLFLNDDRLILISTRDGAFLSVSNYSYDYEVPELDPVFVNVDIFDVSDPAAPLLLSTKKYDGELVNTRMIGSNLHVVFNNQLTKPELDYEIDYKLFPKCSSDGTSQPTRELVVAVEKLREKNMAIIDGLDFADIVTVPAIKKKDGCNDVLRSHAAFGSDVITVATADVTQSFNELDKVSIVGNGGNIYVSTNNIFIASDQNDFHEMYDLDISYDSTVVHRVKLGRSTLDYAGSNAVEGHLLDNSYIGSRYSKRFSMAQFAMSEYEGSFRIATNRNGSWTEDFAGDSMVATFSITEDDFIPDGSIWGLGVTEKLHAVRFVGDKGYLVTFKKVDPLFVLDLSNPSEPLLKGELKIPGFSSYLHPFGENHLIGLGFDADDQGDFAWTQGLKVSLFDVSNPSNPIEVGHRLIGSRMSYSAAVEEHHAFTLDSKKGILSLPLDLYEGGSGGSQYGSKKSDGVVLLNVDSGGDFETIGEIVVESSSNNSWYGDAKVLRTIIIGDDGDDCIITLADDGILMNRIDDGMSSLGNT